MNMRHKKLKVGDRVTCPSVDNVPGTVVEVGYNDFTKVEYDDGVIGYVTADELDRFSPAPAKESPETEIVAEGRKRQQRHQEQQAAYERERNW
jgi:hypothetical protein